MTAASALLAVSGPLRRVALDARGWSSRCRDRVLAGPASWRAIIGGPVGRDHGCRSGAAGTRSLVGRPAALRVEAHQRTSTQLEPEL